MKHHVHILRALFVALVLCFSLTGIAVAQELSGSIVGSVKDANGAAVKGATITVSDVDKKVTVRTATTNDDGQFSIPDLPVSTYDVTVEATSFKKHVESKVKLDVGQKRSVDISLQAGNISETVTVEAAPLTVELTTPAVSTVINGDQVRQLSINNRNFVQLVAMAPGVTTDLEDSMPTGTNNPDTQVVVRTLISVNGARNTSNTFTIDGADITDRGSNLTIQAYPSLDSIGEFQVLRSLYPAESGRSVGGQVNIVTKGGGQKFHGSGFEFVRNQILNANDFASNRTPSLAAQFGTDSNGKLKRKPFHYNDYGFTFGGPIYVPRFREGGAGTHLVPRTFFFFSEEQRWDIRYPLLTNAVVPTTAMKQGIFPVPVCLSATGTTAATCTQILPAGTPLGTVTGVSSVAQQYISEIWSGVPEPNKANLGLDFPALNTTKFRQEILRLDHTSANNKLNLFYRFENDKIPTFDADGTIGARSGLPFVNRTASNSPGRTHTLQGTYTVSPNLVIEGRYTYGYGAILISTVGLQAKSVSPMTLNLPYVSTRDIDPILSISGFNSLTGFSNYIDPSSKDNFDGDVTWIRGNHTMKFGMMYSRYVKTENALSGTNQGSFSTFANTTTGSNCTPALNPSAGVNVLYQNWACFMMGKNVTFTQSNLDLTADLRQRAIEWYGQDQWRFRSNITLNLGVRYSYFPAPWDRNGLLTNFLPSLWNPANAPRVTGGTAAPPTGAGGSNDVRVAGTGNFCNGIIVNAQNFQTGPAAFNCTPTASPFGKYVYQAQKNNFAPRFGIAWDPFKKGTTSIRAGYGIYYDQISSSASELLALNPPYLQTVTQTTTTMGQPIPVGSSLPVVASATPSSIRAIQANFLTPYVQQWSLDVQRQIGKNTVITVGYYASKGTHLNGNTEYNDLPLGKALSSQCATGSSTLQDPGVVTVPCMTAGLAFVGTQGIIDQIRPYRGYRSVNILETRYNSNYNSLQVFAQHRLSGASQFNLAYTWSKNLTDNQTSSVNAAPQDLGNIKAEYGRAVLDRRHVLSGNFIYELPFYRAQHGFTGKVLGGWQASGIITYNSGLPFNVAYSSYDPAGIGYTPAITAGGRPTLLCDPNANAPHTVDQWFNSACFITQTANGTTGVANVAGNAQRGAVDGPPTKRVDFTMAKSFSLGPETHPVALQLRAEVFNIFNHTNFRTLSTSRIITNNLTCTSLSTFSNCSGIGTVTAFRDPRVIQLAIKLNF